MLLRIQADVTGNWVQARDWAEGTTVTLTVHDPTHALADQQVSVVVGPASWNPSDILANFNNVTLRPGFELTVEPLGGGTPTKSYTITNLHATPDVASNTVSGIATAGARVQTCVNLTNGCISRWATADATTGEWTVSFLASSTDNLQRQ